jgi:hypothetical protein
MREICHLQAGQCGNQIGAKVIYNLNIHIFVGYRISNVHTHTSIRYYLNYIFDRLYIM